MHGYVKSDEMGTYTTFSIILGVPCIDVQIQQGFPNVLVYPSQILKRSETKYNINDLAVVIIKSRYCVSM